MKPTIGSFALRDLEQRYTPSVLVDQWILCQDARQIPETWASVRLSGWCLGSHPDLPIAAVVDQQGRRIGVLLGYVVDHRGMFVGSQTVTLPELDQTQAGEIESWIYQHGGRFVAVLLSASEPRVYLDPFGSLSAVYCPALAIVAATPILIPQSADTANLADLNRLVNVPFRDASYPVGLTPRKNVHRLLPNHYLDLRRFQAVRHWPTTNRPTPQPTEPLLDQIASRASIQLRALTERGAATFGLTAGRDSRMLLACARECVDRLTLFTAQFEHPDESAWLDGDTAGTIARDLGLRHRRLRFREPTQSDLEEWVYRTAASVGEVRGWRGSTMYKQLPAGHVDLIAAGSELMRGYWTPEGIDASSVTPDALLRRCGLGSHPVALQAVERWLASLPDVGAHFLLDLFYIEQRLGCWGGVSPYGHGDSGRTEIYPLCHREIVGAMLALPYEVRSTGVFQERIIEKRWPELLSYPFNTPTRRQRVLLAGYRARWTALSTARRAMRATQQPRNSVVRLKKKLVAAS